MTAAARAGQAPPESIRETILRRFNTAWLKSAPWLGRAWGPISGQIKPSLTRIGFAVGVISAILDEIDERYSATLLLSRDDDPLAIAFAHGHGDLAETARVPVRLDRLSLKIGDHDTIPLGGPAAMERMVEIIAGAAEEALAPVTYTRAPSGLVHVSRGRPRKGAFNV